MVAQEREVTVLFADLSRFTPMVEGAEPTQVAQVLNSAFEQLTQAVFLYDGTLDKYMGDGVMAVFGAPLPQVNHAVRAIRAALLMRQLLEGLNQGRPQDQALRMRIGINSGPAVVGDIGSLTRKDYTVIGDGVNIAAYLESLTKQYGTDILISEHTLHEIGDEFTTRLVDRVRIKGKKEPVKIFELLGEGQLALSSAEQAFCEGLVRYNRGEFAEAGKLFKRGADGDPPCRVFLERCQHFMNQPPEPGWDGAWTYMA